LAISESPATGYTGGCGQRALAASGTDLAGWDALGVLARRILAGAGPSTV